SLYSYSAPRHSHSFPTRRSSDLSSSRTVITLMEELDHIQDYLSIQQYRYPDILSFDTALPPELKRALVPPLTLQPFVENAIIHGDRKSTRLNSSHVKISYAVFCL